MTRHPLRSLPIRWQITVLHATILTVVLMFVGVLVWTQLRGFLVDSTATRLRAQSRSLIDAQFDANFEPVIPPRPPKPPDPALPVPPTPPIAAPLQATLAQLADALSSRETAALIIANDGAILARGAYGPQPPTPDAATVVRATRGMLDTQFIDSTGDERTLAALIPLRRNGALIALAQVSTSLRAVDDALARLARYLVIGGVLSVGLATALGVRATRGVLHPLEHMVDVTQRVATGDLSLRVDLPPGRTEIATLGAAFDTMLTRLEATFAAQRRFVADAAHELRTPLTALSGAVELLENGVDDAQPAQTQRMLSHLDTEINRMIRLTNDLLMLSALDAQPRLVLRSTDVSQLAQAVGDQYRTSLTKQTLVVEITPALHALADADKLRQVLLNVLDNARKYTPANGTIALRVQPTMFGAEPNNGQPTIRIAVQDTGPGIPAEALPHLFERFYRVDTARTRAKGGSGLGLAIAQALVQAHGGHIAVESALGAGTTMTIVIPAAASSANVQLASGAISAETPTLEA